MKYPISFEAFRPKRYGTKKPMTVDRHANSIELVNIDRATPKIVTDVMNIKHEPAVMSP